MGEDMPLVVITNSRKTQLKLQFLVTSTDAKLWPRPKFSENS